MLTTHRRLTLAVLALCLLASALIVQLPQAKAATVIIYQNDWENPVGEPLAVTCGANLNQQGINFLYGGGGFTFSEQNTVETVIINRPGFSDPSGIGGDYAIGFLRDVQNDKLALTFDSQGYQFINVQMDISSITAGGCGIPNSIGAPTFAVQLRDAPGGVFQGMTGGTLLSSGTMTAPAGPNTTTFSWTNVTLALDASSSADGHVTVIWDLQGASPYAAIDNLIIAASDNSGSVTTTDLTVSKSNDTADASDDGTWAWSLAVSNTGDAADFANGDVILRDELPAGPAYSNVQITGQTGITGTIDCAYSAPNLTCTANGAVSIGADTGAFTVSVDAASDTDGTFTNPGAGGCAVDPDDAVEEADEENNACKPNEVTVTLPVVETNLLGNGSFERDDNSDLMPDVWQGANLKLGSLKDGRDCNVSIELDCSMRFVGDGNGSRIYQDVVMGGGAGQQFTLTFSSRGDNVPKSTNLYRVQVLVYHVGGGKQTYTINLPLGTHEWRAWSLPITPSKDWTKIRVQIQYTMSKGLVWFDGFNLVEN
jgi:hypothetical protein